MYTVYILQSLKHYRYYVGSIGQLEDRLNRHNTGRSKATKSGVPWKLMFTKHFHTRSEAVHFERLIKSKKSKAFIEELIQEQTMEA